MRVIKLGGSILEQEQELDKFAETIAGLAERAIIVHGGGKSVDAVQTMLGSRPVKIDGLRRTDPVALRAVLMVLCGEMRARLVAALLGHGVRAIGLSGFDAGLIRVRKLDHPAGDLGYVGEVTTVDPLPLHTLLDAGLLPVLSPLSLGPGSQIFNVNADHVAAAIAQAIGASELAFVSDVSGVHRANELIPLLDLSETQRLIANQEIRAGMVPKVQAASQALQAGVRQVRIVDLPGLTNGGGTTLIAGGA